MQLKAENLAAAFNDAMRHLNHQVWDRIGGYVAYKRLGPLAKEDMLEGIQELGFDVTQDLTQEAMPEVVKDISARATEIAQKLAQAPGVLAARMLALDSDLSTEINVPAGCDSLSPAEIRSAVKRGARVLCSKEHYVHPSVTLIIPSGSQDAFYAALDDESRPSIEGVAVRFQSTVEILDPAVLQELFPEKDGESAEPGPPEDYERKIIEAARRTPWFIVPNQAKDKDKAFLWRVKKEPELTGPKLEVKFCAELRPNERVHVVRVAPSRLVIAKGFPNG